MYVVYSLARFLIRKLFRSAEVAVDEPHWHFDRQRSVWVESNMERHAA
ncbi:MAG: hypothetical protein ACREQM_13900 [Candidatus Dormibacteraceae bacterium]